MSCEHGRLSDFKRDGKWTCSHCGREDTWGPSWGYFGALECRRCWMTIIDYVACSDACARALDAAKTTEARVVKERKRQAAIDRLDGDIARLQQQRADLMRAREPYRGER